MQKTMIVTEELLHSKSEFADAQGLIPELIFRLISGSLHNPKELRIPFGGSINQTGWDCILETATSYEPYIPQGLSFWEIGTGDPKRKADEDYAKRTEKTAREIRLKSTFIFVTSRSAKFGWDTIKQNNWIAEKRQGNNWKDIRIIDGTKLVQWLFLFPGIEIWLANQFEISVKGATTPHLHWEELKKFGAPPNLKPELFAINRDNARKCIINVLQRQYQLLRIETKYPEEVIDYLSSVFVSLEKQDQSELTYRCIIIDNKDTWEELCQSKIPHILVPKLSIDIGGNQYDLIEKAINSNHSVIYGDLPKSNYEGETVRLNEIKPYQLSEVLRDCGYDFQKAKEIADKSNGKITSMKRILTKRLPSPPWAIDKNYNLAIATLFGMWNGKSGDINALKTHLLINYSEWIKIIRPLTMMSDPPLVQTHEKWHFVSRFEGWMHLGKYISDEDLDRFANLAINVLCELDPKFDLPEEQRWAASVYGKTKAHSEILRSGIAEGLALLGCYPDALRSCSNGKADRIAAYIVRELLNRNDWRHWASLNDILPLLAEASPSEFIKSIGKILNSNPDTFKKIFEQEGDGLTGWNYITGILWALETLAWSQEYLLEVVMLLGKFAMIDPGGKFVNRPLNTLVDIFLPWHPYTCATFQFRKVAINALIKTYPQVGWELLFKLLPNHFQFTTGTRQPTWRELIADNYSSEITQEEYCTQTSFYAELCIKEAGTNVNRLISLINDINYLPHSVFDNLLLFLSSEQVLSLSDYDKVSLWENLESVASKHRRFSEADWAMSIEQITKISEVAKILQPISPILLYRRLFNSHSLDIIETEDNYFNKREELSKSREKAINEILMTYGINGIHDLIENSTDSYEIGWTLGRISNDKFDSILLPYYLTQSDPKLDFFIKGYINNRFNFMGWDWIDKNDYSKWTDQEKAKMLSFLPFVHETWQRVTRILADKDRMYWDIAEISHYSETTDYNYAVKCLIACERPWTATHCLHSIIKNKKDAHLDLIYSALLGNINSKEPRIQISPYILIEIIKWLQKNPETDIEILAKIEWSYLPLLYSNNDVKPVTLESHMAEEPTFFCEVIKAAFRSEKEMETTTTEEDEVKRNISTNAYHLLRKWRTPPGTNSKGAFDSLKTKEWLDKVKHLYEESGHLGIALYQIGKVLIYTPPDLDGLWINKGVAEILNESENERLREGFISGYFDQRGVYSWSAGEEEKKLADIYFNKARDVNNEGYYYFAESLRGLAESYLMESKRAASEDSFD